MKIEKKNAFNEKWWAYRDYIRQKKSWDGCHHLSLVYDASEVSTVYVVNHQRAHENSEFAPFV